MNRPQVFSLAGVLLINNKNYDTMNCQDCQQKMLSYIDGLLNAEAAKVFETHLSKCVDCRAIFADLQLTYQIIDQEKQQEMNPFLVTRIEQRIARETGRKIIPVRQFAFRAVAAGILLTIAITTGIFLGQKVGQGSQAEQIAPQQKNELYYINDFQQERIEAFLLAD